MTGPHPNPQKKSDHFWALPIFTVALFPISLTYVAAPLNDLTSNNTTFCWTDLHQTAFTRLKEALISPPILDYPRKSDTFVLTTDSSDAGLGAVLSTSRGTVIEYASRALTAAEKNYCTTEKECLAIVWANRKLRHYLIGAHFTLETDRKPLQWLESAKKSHARAQRLERWSLELRAYDFDVIHRPGRCNQHADALSRMPISVVALHSPIHMADLTTDQQNDPVLSIAYRYLKFDHIPPTTGDWTKFPLRRYRQLWSQLTPHESVICRRMKSPGMSEEKLLIVVPKSQWKSFLNMAHDNSGNQGIDRTMARLSETAYWVGMGKDVVHYCTHCFRCQITKAPAPKPVPLQPVISSKPWEFVAVDILKVPMSTRGNQYLLVVQDHFSKWPFAKAIPDQKAERIVNILKDDVFTLVGPPRRLHSDQGQNFESRILGNLCKAFGVEKSHATPYHPMGNGLVERMNRSLLTLLRTYVDRVEDWEAHLQLLLFVYRTTKHATTGISPYEVLFGYVPTPLQIATMPGPVIPDPAEYSAILKRKLYDLRELVEANTAQSTECQ